MRQIKLTPDAGTPEPTVRKFYDWLLRKRLAHEMPFNVVMVDTEADEQYGVMIHCWSKPERDRVLKTLVDLQQGSYPEGQLTKITWAMTDDGVRLPAGVQVPELAGATVGKVFE